MNANLTNPKCIWGVPHPFPLPRYDVTNFLWKNHQNISK